MSSRNLFASIVMAVLLAVGFFGVAPVAYAASAGTSVLKRGEIARNNVIEIKRRSRRPRIHLPVGPAYIYYDYPYYYSRGYYPTHIGGYVYYPYYYYHRRYFRDPVSPRRVKARRK
jgi:hypothetical protein